MNEISVTCEELQPLPDCNQVISFCEQVLDLEGIDNWELSILLCRNPFIRELNQKYRGIDEPTDVLSFNQNRDSLEEGLHIAGDIVVSLDFVKSNEELKRCFIHGILHLNGMEHEEETDYTTMIGRQEQILETLKEELLEVL